MPTPFNGASALGAPNASTKHDQVRPLSCRIAARKHDLFLFQGFRLFDQINSELLKNGPQAGLGECDCEPKTEIGFAAQAFGLTLC